MNDDIKNEMIEKINDVIKYYLYEFSQIIADEFEKTETLFDKLETNLY